MLTRASKRRKKETENLSWVSLLSNSLEGHGASENSYSICSRFEYSSRRTLYKVQHVYNSVLKERPLRVILYADHRFLWEVPCQTERAGRLPRFWRSSSLENLL